MDKKSFLNLFPDEDPSAMAALWEIIEAAFNGRPVVSQSFYTPDVWMKLAGMPGALPAEGGFLPFMDSDRRLFASPLPLAEEEIRVLAVKNQYPQRPLGHRDYMGALMNLGIRREKFSDLFVVDDTCYIPMTATLLPFVQEHLTKVGSNGVSLTEVDPAKMQGFQRAFEEKVVLAASLRLDVLVAEITNLSRSKAEELIRSGRVQLNYTETRNRSDILKTGDILTIRGQGKFRIGEVQGETRKGRLRLIIEKYT